MTTHIGDALVPLQQSLNPVGEVDVHVESDPVAVRKALYVLGALKNAGIKMPYESDLEEMGEVYGGVLGRFSAGVLDNAVAEWIATETDWPSAGEMASLCELIVTENMRKSAEADERERNPEGKWCEECGVPDEVHPELGLIRGYTTRWVRVQDTRGDGHHMRPCSMCLPDRYEAYARGCWEPLHIQRGGCSDCRHYHWPYKLKDPRTTKGRIG